MRSLLRAQQAEEDTTQCITNGSCHRSTSTQTAVEHHLHAFDEGIGPFMEDFAEDSVVITNDATFLELTEIRAFFTALLERVPCGFDEAVIIKRQEIAGEVAFLVWETKPWFPFCADTFVIRNGKIAYQTFAAHTNS